MVGPIPSADGQAAQTVVTFNFGKNGWEDMPATADTLRDISAIDGVDVYVAGSGGQAADSFEAFAGIDSTLLLAALSVVIVILLFTYRSPVLWILPIFSVVVSLGCSLGLVYLLAKYADLTVNGQSQAILSILVIGAGTDYALLLVARYREELRRHEDRHEAMAFALHRAAPAILASAATVAVGMLCLLFAEMSSTAGLGPVAAIGIAMTFLVMVTLLPALLVIFGRWIFWPMRPRFDSTPHESGGLWGRVGRRIAVRPRAVWVITTGLLLIACLGLFRLDANGLSTEDQYTKDFDSVLGQRVLIEHDLVDSSNPIMVAANADRVDEVRTALAGVDGLEAPSEPVVQDGVGFVSAAVPRRPGVAVGVRPGGGRARRRAPDRGRRRPGGRLLRDLPRHQDRLHPRRPGDHPDRAAGRVPDPDPAAAGAGRPGDPDRHRGAVLRGGHGHLGPALRVRLRLRRAPTRRSRCSRSCSWWRSASTTTSS